MSDATEAGLLNRIQSGFPLVPRPFAAVGAEIGMDEAEVIRRIEALKASGVVRRLGAVFDTKALGFASVLVAFALPPERIEAAAAAVSALRGVSHNYEREGRYNLWFTLAAESEAALRESLEALRARTAPEAVLVLPALRIFKIRATFEVGAR